jgi:hypothetical protein
MTSRTVLITIGVAVGLLVVVAVVVSLQSPTQYPSDSPEGAVQGYLSAVNDGDVDAAEAYMTDELVKACSGNWWFYSDESLDRAVITDVEISGETATIQMALTQSYGEPPFDNGSYTHDEEFTLVRSGDVWLISEPAWPMDIFTCREGNS